MEEQARLMSKSRQSSADSGEREDKERRIGNVFIPDSFNKGNNMKKSPIYLLLLKSDVNIQCI